MVNVYRTKCFMLLLYWSIAIDLIQASVFGNLASLAFNGLVGDISSIQKFVPNVANILANKCFTKVGCFDQYAVYNMLNKRLELITPESPEQMEIEYNFLNKKIGSIKHEQLHNKIDIKIDKNKKVLIFIHGWKNDKAPSKWWQLAVFGVVSNSTNVSTNKSIEENLQDIYEPIVLNWVKGAQKNNYSLASANVKVVAASLALFIQDIIKQNQIKCSLIHLIGFGLGAHIAGFAGKRLSLIDCQIGMLTAFDPSLQLYESNNQQERLDRSDAQFVKVIHSYYPVVLRDSLSNYSMSDVDIYINEINWSKIIKSNNNSPSTSKINELKENKQKRIDNFCELIAFKCSNYEEFFQGTCISHDSDNTLILDSWFDKSKKDTLKLLTPQRYFMSVQNIEPFCVKVYIGSYLKNSKPVGSLTISVDNLEIEFDQKFEKLSIYRRLFVSNSSIIDLNKIKLSWKFNSDRFRWFFFASALHVKAVTFTYISHTEHSVQAKESAIFCAGHLGTNLIAHQNHIYLYKCFDKSIDHVKNMGNESS